MGTAAAAVMIRRDRELVDLFRSAGATTPAASRSLGDLGVDEGLTVRRLRRRAVLRESAPGLWYLDEPSWEATRATRRRVLFLLMFVVALAAIFGVFTTGYRGAPAPSSPPPAPAAPAPQPAPAAPAPAPAP